MVGSGNKFGSALSWADEVELEEEAAAVADAPPPPPQAQVHSMRKPDHFGNARPREVVLEEKGIDWKKINQNVQAQQSSYLRQEAKVMMLHKQSIYIPSAHTNKEQSNFSSSHPKQELEYSKLGFEKRENFPISQYRSPIIFAPPPLRYPPKTVAGNPFEPEKENRFNELDGRHSLQGLNRRCHSNPHFDPQVHHSTNVSAVNGGTRSMVRKLKQEQSHKKNLKKPVSYNSLHPRTKFYGQNVVGLSPKSERGSPRIHGQSSIPAGEKDHKHFQCDYAKNVVDGYLTNPSHIVTSQQKRRHHTASRNNACGRMVRFIDKETPFMQAGAIQNIKNQADYFHKAIKKEKANYYGKHKDTDGFTKIES